MPIVPKNRRHMWYLRVDHAGLAALAAASCATLVASICFLLAGVGVAETLLRAVTVFVLTYGATLALLVLLQRALLRALNYEHHAMRAARRAAAAAAASAAAGTTDETRGENEGESLSAQQA